MLGGLVPVRHGIEARLFTQWRASGLSLGKDR
jgi:hypothetical protein